VVKNSSPKAKRVLIEQPLDAKWELVAPADPAEKTRDRYRFAVEAEPGVPLTLTVIEEQPVRHEAKLTDLDDEAIEVYLSAKEVAGEVKAALAQVVERKAALAELASKRQQFEQGITAITEEQSRIRQNMAQLDRQSELYARYVKKFGEQEDQVETLRKDRDREYVRELAARKALDEYLAGLTIP
jgi:chromosome segregation ATPase